MRSQAGNIALLLGTQRQYQEHIIHHADYFLSFIHHSFAAHDKHARYLLFHPKVACFTEPTYPSLHESLH